jgi:hypothetical protein
MTRIGIAAAKLLLPLFLLFAGAAARAVPIEVAFGTPNGSASGSFAFEPIFDPGANPGALSSGRLDIGGQIFEAPVLFYEYYGIGDSLQVAIRANEGSGLSPGDFINLTFGNPDGSSLVLPTQANLFYSFGGTQTNLTGTVRPVPEPLSAALFGAGAGLLLLRRRRRA